MVVDDSIVLAPPPAKVIRCCEAGRVKCTSAPSPPYKWPCFTVWTPAAAVAAAADLSVGDIRDYLGVDSLAYLELDRAAPLPAPPESFCTAPLTGQYPVPVDLKSCDHKLLRSAPVLDLTESSAPSATP